MHGHACSAVSGPGRGAACSFGLLPLRRSSLEESPEAEPPLEQTPRGGIEPEELPAHDRKLEKVLRNGERGTKRRAKEDSVRLAFPRDAKNPMASASVFQSDNARHMRAASPMWEACMTSWPAMTGPAVVQPWPYLNLRTTAPFKNSEDPFARLQLPVPDRICSSGCAESTPDAIRSRTAS
jgi:hypothetical protein